jgi:predicted RNA-binding Zn ribbon-like protein
MAAKMTKPFELHGDPALDFVNTLDNRFNKPDDPDDATSARPPEELLNGYNDLLRFLTQSELLTEAKARRLRRLDSLVSERKQVSGRVFYQARALREHLATVIYAIVDGLEVPDVSLAAIDASIKQAAVHRRLISQDTVLTWQWDDLGCDLSSPLWLFAQAADTLLLSDKVSQIRSCAAETCRWLFLDTSKNHTRRWCNMKICGNRMKARRFHRRAVEALK